VMTVEKFPKNCDPRAIGCYEPENLAAFLPARIYIKPHLTPWARECVMAHELKHHAGWDHPEGLNDCDFDNE
jgi:hypothetical protein